MAIPDLRPLLYINGILLCVIGGAMLLPAMVDYASDSHDWKVFVSSSVALFFVGGALLLTNKGPIKEFSIRQIFLFTTMCWICSGVAGALPFYLSEANMNLASSVFESVSGLTTTGASSMTNLDSRPPGLLLWRALLNGLGGIGIVVMSLAILPTLRIGGMQLFRSESSDKMEKVLPRSRQLAGVTTVIFISLVMLCAFCYYLAGMNGFDAICHALSTVATGGFSTHDASFGYFNSPLIEAVAIPFMLLGCLPLMYYFLMWRGNFSIVRDSQVRVFLTIAFLAVVLLALWRYDTTELSFLTALRQTSFHAISSLTGSGFVAADFTNWGHFMNGLLFMLMAVGGCSGSTAGGIKIFRFQILYEIARNQIFRLLQPHGVFLIRYGGKTVSEQEAASVMSFFLLFAFAFMVGAVGMSYFGYDFLSSMSASIMALSNTGLGLGEIVGPAGNFAGLPDGAKWLLSFLMLLGRVELFTILVLLTPRFWRD